MNKPSKIVKTVQTGKEMTQNNEDVDVRLKRQIRLCSQLKIQQALQNTQLQYCCRLLQTLKQEHDNFKKSCILARSSSFGGWQSKLKQLIIEAIANRSDPVPKKSMVLNPDSRKSGNCSQGKHLQQIFNDKVVAEEKEQLAKLQDKLVYMYDRIGQSLREELMSDKILSRIKRQARRVCKLKVLQHLQKQIQKYQSWKDNSQDKLSGEAIAKEIEGKIVHNLEVMKLLMNKKIINSDYIYEQFQDKQKEIHRKIDKADQLTQLIQQNYANNMNNIAQKYKERQSQSSKSILSEPLYQKTSKPLNIQSINSYIQQIQNTLQQLQSYQPPSNFQQRTQKINTVISSILTSSKR